MKNYSKTRAALVSQLCATDALLKEPAPSWEPKAHVRYQELYRKAAFELAALEVSNARTLKRKCK